MMDIRRAAMPKIYRKTQNYAMNRALLTASSMLLSFALVQPATAQINDRDLLESSIDGQTAKIMEVNGLPVRYYEAGEGEPLILLHGGRRSVFNSANMWAANITGLAKHFHVYAVDRLGYGLSGMREDGDFRYAAEVEFLDDFIEEMGLDHVNLAGNSSGGALVLEYGMAHPEKVITLTVAAVGPQTEFFDKPKGDVMREACGAVGGQMGWSCWMSAMSHREGALDQSFWEASQHMMSLPSRRAVAEAQLTAPTEEPNFWVRRRTEWQAGGVHGLPILWTCGSHDVLDWAAEEEQASLKGCVAFSHTLGANNPNVKTIIYNKAGHFPYREYPELFNNDLISFINYWDDRRAR
jgi:pimeloyl-ACP methyl ester carboxylesterase